MESDAQEELQNQQSTVSVVGSVDVTISGWILEFLLRKLVEDHLVDDFLPILSTQGGNFRLKKTLYLRKIWSEISNGEVSEKLLDYLQHIEECDRAMEVAVLESMKKAYCAVAVNSTVKFLEGKIENRAKYFEAFMRIWKGRICELEKSRKTGLFSDELRKWMTDIETAVWDTTMCKTVLRKNTKIDVMQEVKAYLEEAWEHMGPSFLELVATWAMRTENAKGEMQDKGKDPVCDQIGEEMPGSPNANQDIPATTNDSSSPFNDVGVNSTDKGMQKRLSKRKHVNIGGRCTRRALHAKSKGVKIHDTEELSKRTLHEKYGCVPSPEVLKAHEALRSSSLDLQVAVKDPLPEAMRFSETFTGDKCVASADAPAHLAEEVVKATQSNGGNSGNTCTEAAQNSEGHPANLTREAPHANENNTGNQCCRPKNDVPPLANENNTGNQCYRPKSDVPGPSLMERNNTAHTHEWHDIVCASPIRCQLPCPTTLDVSPLKIEGSTKISRRRKNRKWSVLEEDTLRTAVQKFGKGNWKFILKSYPEIFEERTEVDLKDKWRNMVR